MKKRRLMLDACAVAVVAVAAFLRLIYLDEIPSCLEYDEAANVILAGEIARGKAFPIFIRPYTGKEALYFYLAAGVMKLAGITPFALRLTSAGLGVLGVALTYFFVRELFAASGLESERHWLALFSAALVAVSYWQVNLSRFGYRPIVLPPLLALTCGFTVRGLRTEQRKWIVLAGAWAGLSAYTYLSVRLFPILLLLLWIWILIADRRRWRLRLGQLFLFGLAALVVFAPLGVFFLRNPETFSVRLEQVSVFSPEVNKGDLWGKLGQTIRLAFGMFTVAGDTNPLYNYPGKPVFDRVVGPFFYLGLSICAWRLLLQKPGFSQKPGFLAPSAPDTCTLSRLPYFFLPAWLLIMMIPNVLSAHGVPHSPRATALVPAVFVVAALGIVVSVRWLGDIAARLMHRSEFQNHVVAAVFVLLLGYQGVRTYHDYVRVWAGSAAPYYKGNEALIRAADLLNAHPEADPYVATGFHQHATLAVTARNYQQIRWMSGQTLVFPPPDAPPALLIYDHTNPVDPLLRERYLPPETLFHRELGPDGGVAFEAYWLSTRKPGFSKRPGFSPESPMQVNLGHTLAFLGYDLNVPALSGDVLDVTLYFEVLREVDRDDYTFFAHLVDDLGFRWGGETFFHYPSAQWRQGEVMLFRLQFPIAPGAPPGVYTINVGVFSRSLDARLPVLNEIGQMAGTVVSVGPIQVDRATAPPTELPTIQQPLEAAFGDAPTFLGSDRDRSDLRPGETLALTLYWQVRQSVERELTVSAWLAGVDGDVPLWHGNPVHGLYPFTQWPAGEFIRDRYALRLPIDTPAGDYDLRLALLDSDGTPLATANGTTWLSLGTIHVHATDRLWEPPAFEHPVGARLGEQVELLGYDLDREFAPGDTLHLTLIWRCQEAMDTAYTVFTHLLDAGEQVRGQKDNPPVNGTYPTTLWVPGEVVVDSYEIPVAADAAPGKYVIEVGMYDPATMQRLPVLDPTGAIGDRILLTGVEVVGSPPVKCW